MIRLTRLRYDEDALAPVMSADTVRTHHGHHHAGYVANVNRMVRDGPLARAPLEAILRETRDAGLLRMAGQAWNHGFFFRGLAAQPTQPGRGLRQAIAADFGDLDAARAAVIEAGLALFGSGWVWLAVDAAGLHVAVTSDGVTLAGGSARPILLCDLWEHAYYLDHRNDRGAFLKGWWDRLIDWDFAEMQFAAARAGRPGWRYADEPAEATADEQLEDALDAAEWRLQETHVGRPDPDDAERIAATLEDHAVRLREARPAPPGLDDLDRRIRAASARLRKPPAAEPWPTLPAF